MSDLEPIRGNSIIPIDEELKKKQNEIRINEKKSVIAGLNQRLTDLIEVEEKKVRLQIEILNKEIKFLQNPTIDVNTSGEE